MCKIGFIAFGALKTRCHN